MKRLWKIAGIAVLVAVLGVVAVGAVAIAQEGTSSTEPFDFTTRFKEALAGILGISVDEYEAAVDQAQDQVVDEAVTAGQLTEDQAEKLRQRLDRAPDMGLPGMGRGGHGSQGGTSRLLAVAADKLGLSVADLQAELQDGKSIATLAADKGVDTQTIIDAYLVEVKADLDESVAAGDITQEQADAQLQQAEERAVDRLDNTGPEGLRGPGGRHGDKPDSSDGSESTEDS